MAGRKRKQRKIHLDDGSLRHGSYGQRSRFVFERILGTDNQGLFFLDKANPVKEWKNIYGKIGEYKNKLNELKIDKLRVIGPDVDLKINMGKKKMGRRKRAECAEF